jgi:DNA-binding response OmpR family regulator
MRVLLIEPDKILARTYMQQLLLANFIVDVAHDGQEAVHCIEENVPDAIVIEPQLAAHSGIEFLHELRSYEDWAVIPAIIFSSVPEQSFNVSEKVWQRLGVVRYFYKPSTTAKQLVGALRALGEPA